MIVMITYLDVSVFVDNVAVFVDSTPDEPLGITFDDLSDDIAIWKLSVMFDNGCKRKTYPRPRPIRP